MKIAVHSLRPNQLCLLKVFLKELALRREAHARFTGHILLQAPVAFARGGRHKQSSDYKFSLELSQTREPASHAARSIDVREVDA